MKKRNVNADEHLSIGGFLTGFFACMGCLPAAGVTAAITSAVVGNDIQRAKREEAALQETKDYQKKHQEFMTMWREIDEMVRYLVYYMFPPEGVLSTQMKAEQYFANAQRIKPTAYNRPSLNGISFEYSNKVDIEILLELAENAKEEDRFTDKVITLKSGMPEYYAVKVDDTFYWSVKPVYFMYPIDFKKRIEALGIEFRPYEYEEFVQMKKDLKMKLYEPYKPSWCR